MKDVFIFHDISVKDALKKLDLCAAKVLLVVDAEKRLLGALSDGDIRRHLLKGGGLETTISEIYNTKPVVSYTEDKEIIKKLLLEKVIDLLPIIDTNNKVINVVGWEDVFSEKKRQNHNGRQLNIPAVIMAGGRGTRLKPFTNVLPKPLIPIGEKTVLELLIDNLFQFGIKDYYFTVNFRGEMIKAYFDSIPKFYSVSYIWEKEFYGTAGSLALIPDLNTTFIVSNCDIIVKADYIDIFQFHKKNKAFLTVVSSIQHHSIPYGVIEYNEGGIVTRIKEKPEFSFPINTGVYFLEPETLRYIPENTVFHMTHLIEALIKDKKKVITYFVNEKDYIDIGQWEEYKENVALLS